MVSLDDHHRAIAFTFGDNGAGLRVRRYVSTMAARPITFSNHAYVEWSSQFDLSSADVSPGWWLDLWSDLRERMRGW